MTRPLSQTGGSDKQRRDVSAFESGTTFLVDTVWCVVGQTDCNTAKIQLFGRSTYTQLQRWQHVQFNKFWTIGIEESDEVNSTLCV